MIDASEWDQQQPEALRHAPHDAPLSHSADSVQVYLSWIGKTKLLTAGDEVALAKRIEAGLLATSRLAETASPVPGADPALATLRRELCQVARDGARAKDHLLQANLRLVVSVAKRYSRRGMPFLDLIQEGNIGLIRAAEKFDYTKGYKFSTYATWWIRQAISRAIGDQARTVRLPIHLVDLINKLGCIDRDLLRDLGREPTLEELAHALDSTPQRVRELKRHAREPLSLEQPIGAEGDGQFGDFIADAQALVAFDEAAFTLLREQLDVVLATLTEREAAVIRLRFGLSDREPCTLDELGQVYGLTRERIRQIEMKALSKLRHPARSQCLQGYLDD